MNPTRQHSAIRITDTANGSAIVARKSGNAMPKREFKKMFCGLPNGRIMPPRLAAIACMTKVNGRARSLPVLASVTVESGSSIRSAMSLVANIEQTSVTPTRAHPSPRSVLKRRTTACATVSKNPALRSARMTASSANRQASVLRSK